jgi:hypothetical protein
MDCSASTGGLSILLPDATQGSLGTDIFIRNTGANTFTVTDATGSASRTVLPGVTVYFYLTNNTVGIGGIWGNITLGTGTSAADAATLAGAGLTTVAGQLAVSSNIVEVSATPTITDASRANTYVWTGGVGAFTLPAYTGLSNGWWIGFRNNGTGTLTISPTSPSLLNGLASINLNPGDSGFIYYESSTGNFFTVGWTAPSNVTFTSGTYDVDSITGSTFSLVSFAPIIQTYVALSGVRTTNLTVMLPAITQLYILVNNTSSGTYNLQFNVAGSSGSPVVLGAGQVATVLSEASGLYVLTQSTTNVFIATNGSATAPSFTFVADEATGLFLKGTSVLGITANGVEMLDIDNTNTMSPIISSPASLTIGGTLTAALISGGAF